MNLLENYDLVVPTAITRKLTLNGVTQVFPVFKININALYYNDQNDRIASWISQYKSINGNNSLSVLDKEEYNNVIENFIVESNPQSIDKTQLNISIVGQREPGVVLLDGRIIDGNRRYTCIRRLAKEDPSNCWFEAVILDVDLLHNKKAIKMLELSIQHGEEKRVDYNHIEKLIGIYQDVVESELLTVKEYADSTNETVKDVNKKVLGSLLLAGFLEYIKMPKQFFIAREFQITSVISDMVELLNRTDDDELKEKLKKTLYLNILLNAVGDSRLFIKNITTLLSQKSFDKYYKLLTVIEEKVFEIYNNKTPTNYYELISFSKNNYALGEELKYNLEHVLKGAKKKELLGKPVQIINKTIKTIRDIDVNLFSKMSPLEKSNLINEIKYLEGLTKSIKCEIVPEEDNYNDDIDTSDAATTNVGPVTVTQVVSNGNKKVNYELIPSCFNDYVDVKVINNNKLTNLMFKLDVRLLYPNNNNEYELFFINSDNEVISNVIQVKLNTEYQGVTFELNSTATTLNNVYLAIRKTSDEENELRFLNEYSLNVSFVAKFDF